MITGKPSYLLNIECHVVNNVIFRYIVKGLKPNTNYEFVLTPKSELYHGPESRIFASTTDACNVTLQ